jgi:hypothetical protein
VDGEKKTEIAPINEWLENLERMRENLIPKLRYHCEPPGALMDTTKNQDFQFPDPKRVTSD